MTLTKAANVPHLVRMATRISNMYIAQRGNKSAVADTIDHATLASGMDAFGSTPVVLCTRLSAHKL
jgi:hypothetical protein